MLGNVRESICDMPPSATLKMNETIREWKERGEEIFALGFGQAAFPASQIVCDLLGKLGKDTKYARVEGSHELRKAICSFYGQKQNLAFKPEQIIVGPGSKILFFAIIFCIQGDFLEIAPSWVSYKPQAILAGNRVVTFHTEYEDRYLADPKKLDQFLIDSKKQGYHITKCVLNYPCNPTGQSYKEEELVALAEIFRKHKIIVISDEIYSFLKYDGVHSSLAHHYSEGTILSNGLSKDRSLGGYRLGFCSFPSELYHIRDAVKTFGSETWSCSSTPIQHLAVHAYTIGHPLEKQIYTHRKIYSILGRTFARSLQKLGLEVWLPEGGFYCYPNFRPFQSELANRGILDSKTLAEDLLEKQRIATLPGISFGDKPSHLSLRLALVDFDGEKALEKLEQFPDIQEDEFFEISAPNMKRAVSAFERYLTDL